MIRRQTADDAPVRALAESNSHGNPYFVYDPTLDLAQANPPPDTRSRSDALERAAVVDAKQATPLLGLLELAPTWLAHFGRSRADAFDPCTNIAIGTALLSEFDVDFQRTGRAAPAHHSASTQRGCVLRRYAHALRMPDLETVVTLELHVQRPVPLGTFASHIFPKESKRLWGPDCIFALPTWAPVQNGAVPEPASTSVRASARPRYLVTDVEVGRARRALRDAGEPPR